MSEVVSPSEVTLGGQTVSLDSPPNTRPGSSEREQFRSVIDSFPGQTEACPLCGSFASEAPEGVHGVHAPTGPLDMVGDAVWKAEHCFKCGFRNNNTTVTREAELYAAFRSWLAQSTKNDLAHPSLNPPTTSDDMKQLTDLANRLGVTINPTSSAPMEQES